MTNKLFSTIYGNVGTNIQDTSSAMATIIKVYCNNAYREILRRVNWDGINPSYQFTLVIGTQDYNLPTNFGKELYCYDNTNKLYIPFISLTELAEKFTDTLASQGEVSRYTTFLDNVRVQPSSASTLSISSSATGDTTQTVHIVGEDSNNVELSEDVTLNGASAQTSSNTYLTIRSITKGASTTGRITVTSNAGAVTNAVLQPADLDYKVKKIRFHYIPGAAITIRLPYHVRPTALSDDNDVPMFDCADGIELGATASSWRYKRQMGKAQEFERLFEKWIIDSAWDKENQPNQTHLINPKTYERDYV